MRTMLIGLAFILIGHPVSLTGQGRSEPPGRTTTLGATAGLGWGTPALGIHAAVTVSNPAVDVVLRHAGTSDLAIFQAAESTSDLALLLGRRHRWSRSWIGAAAGPAFVWRRDRRAIENPQRCPPLEAVIFFPPVLLVCERYEQVTSTAVGLATQIEMVWAPLEHVGWGVTAFGNLNGRRSFAGLTFAVHVGWLR